MKRFTGIAMVAFVAALALSAVAVSSASANLPLKCYKVSNFKAKEHAGDWTDSKCIKPAGSLLGEFVLAEPVHFTPKTPNLWCALVTPDTKTGSWSNNECTVEVSDSKFIEVIVLPDISVLPGEKYPLHLNFADNGKTPTSRLEDISGNVLTGAGLLLLFLISELSALGTFEALFLHVLNAKKQACESVGDKSEEVLISGEFHIVPLGNQVDAILYLFKELTIECNKGAQKIKIKGSLLSTLNFEKKTEAEDFTALGGKLEGKSGVNTLTKYVNDEGKEVEAKLEDNFGNGFVQAAETLGEEVKAEALEKKMFLITGR